MTVKPVQLVQGRALVCGNKTAMGYDVLAAAIPTGNFHRYQQAINWYSNGTQTGRVGAAHLPTRGI
jgi:hypothetical protein